MSAERASSASGRTELRVEHNPEQTLIGFAAEGEPTVRGAVAVDADDVPLRELPTLAEHIEDTVRGWSE